MDSNCHKHEIFVIAICKLLVLSCKALDTFSDRGFGTWETCKFFLLAFVVICDWKKRHLKPNYSRPQHWSEKSMQGEPQHRLCVAVVPFISDRPLHFIVTRYFSSIGDPTRISDAKTCEVSSISDRLREPLTCHQRLKTNGAIRCSWN